MVAGIRMATGIDFSAPKAPQNMGQVRRAEARAREIFPLAQQVEPTPWVGLRSYLSGMRPVIGPATGHSGLWFAFAHAHHRLTLGPVTGRLVSEMITEDTPCVDPTPFHVDRFRA